MKNLTQQEWIELGREFHEMQNRFNDFHMKHLRLFGKTKSRAITAMRKKMNLIASDLDNEICRQHPDWNFAIKVFFGPENNPRKISRE